MATFTVPPTAKRRAGWVGVQDDPVAVDSQHWIRILIEEMGGAPQRLYGDPLGGDIVEDEDHAHDIAGRVQDGGGAVLNGNLAAVLGHQQRCRWPTQQSVCRGVPAPRRRQPVGGSSH